jgi:hypothetical protein
MLKTIGGSIVLRCEKKIANYSLRIFEPPIMVMQKIWEGIDFRRLKVPRFDSTNPCLNTLLVRNNLSHTNSIILSQ